MGFGANHKPRPHSPRQISARFPHSSARAPNSESKASPKGSFVSGSGSNDNKGDKDQRKKIFLSEDFYAMAYLGYSKEIAEEHNISDK